MYEYGNYGFFTMFLWLAVYFFYTGCQFAIAKKISHKYPWWAFVPVLNLYQTVEMAGKEWYWFVFYFIPFVNIFAFAAVWWEIAKTCNKSPIYGILMLLPIINFFAIAGLALGEVSKPAAPRTTTYKEPEKTREPADVI